MWDISVGKIVKYTKDMKESFFFFFKERGTVWEREKES